MPIQPIKYQNYKEIQDLEDVTPVITQTHTSTRNFWCKQHVIFWTSLFVLIVVLILCVYFGVDDEMNTSMVYQTSFGTTGGIKAIESGQRCQHSFNLHSETLCSTSFLLSAILTLVPTRKFQTIIGFGGAFTESTGFVFSKLSTQTQQKVVELFFGETGIGFSMGRIHINSCDFSLSSYNYDDQPDDFDLNHFDSGLIRDSMYVIPLIHQAVAASSRPILLVASPWSPPAWMKVTNPPVKPELKCDDTLGYWQVMTGSAQPHGLRDDPRVKTAWASYITKFLEAYRDKGVAVWAVTPQNEPEFAAPWEACVFNASYEGDFIANYLGPTLKGSLPEVKILGFDHNKDHLLQWAETLMGDPAVERYLDGMAFHWYGGNDRVTDGTYGYEALNATHHLRPDKILLATEGCTCPGVRIDDWLRAERLAHDVMYDLMNFSQGWIDWNLLLDSTGGPNHAGNVCDAPIVALSDYSDVHVQPKYYYMGHISKFVTPGSVRVQSSIVGDFQLRAMDPNIQAGVEVGLFDCERSVRQTWQMRPENGSHVFTLALATAVLAVDSFADAPFPLDQQPAHVALCVTRGDSNRGYLRLVECDSTTESALRLKWNKFNQMIEAETGLCVSLSGDVLESGALLSLEPCASPSPLKQSFAIDEWTGEIQLNGFDMSGATSLCWTAGWPFLSSVAFVNPEGHTVVVVMNEGSVKIDISITSNSFFRLKRSVIDERSIQTIILQS